MENSDGYYKMKYLKYKAKYENIKQNKQYGGADITAKQEKQEKQENLEISTLEKNIKDLETNKDKSSAYISNLIDNLIKKQQILIKRYKLNKGTLKVILKVDTIKKLLDYASDNNIRTRYDTIDGITRIELAFFLNEILKSNLLDQLVKDKIPILEIIKLLLKAGVNPNENINGETAIDIINKLIENNKKSDSPASDLGNQEINLSLIYDIQKVFIEEQEKQKKQQIEINNEILMAQGEEQQRQYREQEKQKKHSRCVHINDQINRTKLIRDTTMSKNPKMNVKKP
jgi:hypothetical protein